MAILPETNGRVSEIFVKWRDTVEKGAPIFKLDSTKQEADLELAGEAAAVVGRQRADADATEHERPIEDPGVRQELRCDFAVLGPLQQTPTHPEATGIGWDAFATMREHVSLPIYAIGGMTQADIAIARTHGAQGIAAIRALWPTPLL